MDRYEEALERARQGMPIDEVFPELKESEDERIRKEMIHWLKGFIGEEEGCGYTDGEIRERIAYLEKQKGAFPIPDKFSGLKSLLLQYLQSAANRKDDAEIESDTDLWGRKILDYVWKCEDEKQKEPKPLPPFDEMSPEERMNHPLYLEGFNVGKSVGEALKGRKKRVADSSKTSVEWSEKGEKIRAKLLSYFNGFTESTAFGRHYFWQRSK